jgi:hypothetical protein
MPMAVPGMQMYLKPPTIVAIMIFFTGSAPMAVPITDLTATTTGTGARAILVMTRVKALNNNDNSIITTTNAFIHKYNKKQGSGRLGVQM